MGGPRGDTLRPRPCLLAIATAVALALSASPGAARAAAPNDTIHACYSGSDRNELHVTATGRPCPPGEKSLSWQKHAKQAAHDGKATESTTYGLSVTTGKNTTFNADTTTDGGGFSLSDTVTKLASLLLLAALVALALLALVIPAARWLLGLLFLRWNRPWFLRFFRRLGPVLQIEKFEDSAMPSSPGTPFAFLTQTKLGQRDPGSNLYLVTGEQGPNRALVALQEVPQTRLLAAGLYLLRGTWARRPLIVSGSLMPADGRGAAAVALTLRRKSNYLTSTEIWPTERPGSRLSAAASNRVLATAAAGWIEHTLADQTPGPPAHEVFLSRDPKSWALFRAGAELSRLSHLAEAGDAHERALAIDPENIGALVDLAHLRRRGGHFEGAETLARSAINLIEARADSDPLRKNDDDSDWYRAQIVLATVYTEWAKDADSRDEPGTAVGLRRQAFERAMTVVETGMKSRDRIAGLLGEKDLARGLRGGKIRFWTRRKAYRWARFKRRRFDPRRAVELYELLTTTFEPGALLIIAANCPFHSLMPPAARPREAMVDTSDADRRKATAKQIRDARTTVSKKLALHLSLDPRPLIAYVEVLPQKSPRVLYNLACYYGMAASRASDDPAARSAYVKIACENLRQAISRFPPQERKSVLDTAWKDDDLMALRKAPGPSCLQDLHKLIPT